MKHPCPPVRVDSDDRALYPTLSFWDPPRLGTSSSGVDRNVMKPWNDIFLQYGSFPNMKLKHSVPLIAPCIWLHKKNNTIRYELLNCIEHTQWKILEAWVNVCWEYYVESVSKMYLVLSVTLLTFFAICGFLCVKLAHSSLGDREIYIHNSSYYHHQIGIIYLSHCCHICRGSVPEVVVQSYAGSFIYIPGKLGFLSFITVQSYDVRK